MEAKPTIHKILKSEGWYGWRFQTLHARYWMWRLRSQRERGEEKGYSSVKWLISPVSSSFHRNIGFLLTLLRNKDIKAKIGSKNDETFKNIFITTVLKWTSIQFAFRQCFCTFLTQRRNTCGLMLSRCWQILRCNTESCRSIVTRSEAPVEIKLYGRNFKESLNFITCLREAR